MKTLIQWNLIAFAGWFVYRWVVEYKIKFSEGIIILLLYAIFLELVLREVNNNHKTPQS